MKAAQWARHTDSTIRTSVENESNAALPISGQGVGLTAQQRITKGFKVRPSSHSDETASFYSLFKFFSIIITSTNQWSRGKWNYSPTHQLILFSSICPPCGDPKVGGGIFLKALDEGHSSLWGSQLIFWEPRMIEATRVQERAVGETWAVVTENLRSTQLCEQPYRRPSSPCFTHPQQRKT